jgi:ATP-dependent Clp protease ATP-binding subunit ClpC
MQELFTHGSRRVVTIAQAVVKEMKHEELGTEHLLIGLVELREGLSRQVLHGYNLTSSMFREQLEEGSHFHMRDAGYTMQAKQVLARSVREAEDRGSEFVDDIDILLSILQPNEDNEALTILKLLGDADIIGNLRALAFERISGRETFELAERISRSLIGHSKESLQQILQFIELSSDERQRLLDSID